MVMAMTAADIPVPAGADFPVTILLAEDEQPVRQLVRSYLESAGYKVIEGQDGEDAIRAASEYNGRIDLLVTDVMMPRASGLQVARSLAHTRPEIKVLFISGYAAGFNASQERLPFKARFVPKPFVRKSFLTVVGELLASCQQQNGQPGDNTTTPSRL